MDDDFNAPGALAAIFELVTACNRYLADAAERVSRALSLSAADTVCELTDVLGIQLVQAQEEELPAGLVDLARERAGFEGDAPADAAQTLLDARQAARKAKDWTTADAIRDGITALGLVLEDTASGARLRRA